MKKHTLEHLKSIPLWKLLDQCPEKELILDQQGIRGLYELLFQQSDQVQFKLQKRRNLHYLENALSFIESAKNLSKDIYLLKGACLLGEIYPSWGERFMSDIDIYCEDMEGIEEAALAFGMKQTNPKESYWLGNSHKREYFLETSLGIIPFEFHSQLFWHKNDPSVLSYFKYSNWTGLGLEESLVFLIGHYAFQHSCQKLYWLFDIYLFLLRFDNQISYQRFNELIGYFDFSRSLLFTKSLLKKAFNYDWVNIYGEASFPLRESFLFEDSQRHWYYLSLKWYLKNGIKNNVRYNLAWLKH